MTSSLWDMKGYSRSKQQDWSTPQDLYDRLDAEFHFSLDPCASPENAKCAQFFTVDEDGLAQSWEKEWVFMNPPYGREINGWVAKAYHSRAFVVVGLLPARTDTAWFHDYIYNGAASEIRFLRGRLKFSDAKWNAPFPCMVVVWR